MQIGWRNKLSALTIQFSIETPPQDRILLWQYALLAILAFFTCYVGLTAYAILDLNEGLYAEVAREMLTGRHFIVPYLNNVPYLEKPPLLYWLIALSYHNFGVNDFAARIVPSTITLLTALLWFYFGKRLQILRVGWLTAVILLSSLVFIIIGRLVFFDMLLTLCLSGSLLSFYLWHQQAQRRDLLTGYVFLALAILTKGLMAFVLVPLVLVVFMWLMQTEKHRYKALFDRKALLLFLAIVLPWHLLAMASQWRFTWEYFFNNQLLRFFNLRVPHDYHTGPIYYYVPRVIAYLLPWSLLLPWLFSWPKRWKRPFDPLKTFLWTWFIAMFVFFSLSGDKGDYYLIIAAPAIAFLLAQKIDDWLQAEKSRYLTFIFSFMAVLIVIGGAIAFVFYHSSGTNIYSAINTGKMPYFLNGPLALLIVIIAGYGLLGGYLCFRNPNKPMLPLLLLIGLIVPNLLFYLSVKSRTQLLYSQAALANYVKAQYAHRDTYLYQDYEAISSFVYYNREPSTIVDSHSADLYFGAKTDEGKKYFISTTDFLARAKQQNVYLVMRINKFPAFQKLPGTENFCVVQRNGDVLLLSNSTEDCKATIETDDQKAFNLDDIKKHDTPRSGT